MTDAARNVPQFTISMDVAMARAKQVVSDFQTDSNGPRFTITAFLVRACAWALRRHPLINAGVNMDSHEIIEWADINIGVAVAAPHGLLVPVIHQADRLDAGTVAQKLDDLSCRARDGKLRSEEMRGGTFTISNLGMFGVDHFTAIVNPPQAAILAVSQMAKRAVVSPDNQVSVQLMADFTLTADHRVVDGALAAQFLADVKQAVEHPGLLI
ncbi:MAG: dihydrolipoamide acetyltransferase [Chloroflexi bacterium]|nr:MAG: dihydrolipoamide acetyltransferase [Chloroflexota bacterium]